jgi:anti-sigma factor RsiW
MNEKEMSEMMMTKHADEPICRRADDLVAYLYGEASRTEAQDFERHMQTCASCASELASFSEVRQSVGEWRQQALGSINSHAITADHARAREISSTTQPRKRSALAAVREFFALSPVWMRAATAMAALFICALIAAFAMRFVERPQAPIVAVNSSQETFTKAQMESIVADRVRQERETWEARQSAQTQTVASVATPAPSTVQPVTTNLKRSAARRPNPNVNETLAHTSPVQISRHQLQLVAEHLPFTYAKDEERLQKLPRLYDLVDDSN